MKMKTKIELTATAIAFISLMITTYYTEPVTSTVSPQIAPVSEVVVVDRVYTPPDNIEPLVAEEIEEISTLAEEITQPTHQQEVIVAENKITLPQPTEKETMDTALTQDIQTPTKPNLTTETKSDTPQNGDVRVINSQQQGYLIGFGWVDYMGENECIFEEGMYENGNKVGVMGDINKIVGKMD